MATFNRIKTWGVGEVLTSTDLNAEFANVYSGFTPSKIDGLSTTTTAMQTAISPGSTGAESPAGDIGGEITRLRYVAQHIKGTANWYTPLMDAQTTPQEISLQSLYTQLQGFLGNLMPPGLVAPYGGTTAPTNWLLCDGSAYLRTGTYANLFAVIGTSFGYGDNSTTFNVPDLRGMFLRGAIANLNSTGSGTVSGPDFYMTFTGHGLRTGMRLIFTGGAIGSTTFVSGAAAFAFARVIDANTLQLYSDPTLATNLGSTTGVITSYTGANTATIRQAQDPDLPAHFRQLPGGNAAGIGSAQRDALGQHVHNSPALLSVTATNAGATANPGGASFVQSITNNYSSGGSADGVSTLGLSGSGVGFETRPLSTTVNYIIRY